MPDTRGDVLCPTCGQWTPPAPFCTECGAALQPGFQDAAGQGSSVFRRGNEVDRPGSPWGSAERFEPEPEDAAARSAAGVGAGAGAARVDHLAEAEPAGEPPWPTEPGMAAPPPAPPSPEEEGPMGRTEAAAAAAVAAAAAAEPPAETPPPEEASEEAPAPKRKSRSKAAAAAGAAGAAGDAGAAGAADAAAAAGATGATQPAAPVETAAPPPPSKPLPAPPPPVAPPPIGEPPPPPPPITYAGPPRDGDDGNSGVSGIVFVAFLGLGVLALLGGAILGGVFGGPSAEASPTPSLVAEATPTPDPTPSPSVGPSAAPSQAGSTVSPAPTPPPAVDGFIARAEPCDEQPSDSTCDNSGAENDGEVWILISFRHAQPSDVIAVAIRDESGTTVDQGSIPLNFCGANTDCAGYTYFFFSNLDDGEYDVSATRNGSEVATTSFEVN